MKKHQKGSTTKKLKKNGKSFNKTLFIKKIRLKKKIYLANKNHENIFFVSQY